MVACSLAEASSSMTFVLFDAGNLIVGKPERRYNSCSIGVPSILSSTHQWLLLAFRPSLSLFRASTTTFLLIMGISGSVASLLVSELWAR